MASWAPPRAGCHFPSNYQLRFINEFHCSAPPKAHTDTALNSLLCPGSVFPNMCVHPQCEGGQAARREGGAFPDYPPAPIVAEQWGGCGQRAVTASCKEAISSQRAWLAPPATPRPAAGHRVKWAVSLSRSAVQSPLLRVSETAHHTRQ